MPAFDPKHTCAVLVGTQSYQSGLDMDDLVQVKNNVLALFRILSDDRYLGIPVENIDVLIDVGRPEIRRSISAAVEKDGPLIVYYSGHGLPGKDALLLPLSTTVPHDVEDGSLSFNSLAEIIREKRNGCKIVIIDTCFAGRALSVLSDATQTVEANATVFDHEEKIIGIASSSKYATAEGKDDSSNHTMFSGKLIGVLRDGIQGRGETLTIQTIYNEVRRRLPKNAPEPKFIQKGVGDIGLVHNVRAVREAGGEAGATETTSLPPGVLEFPDTKRTLDSLIESTAIGLHIPSTLFVDEVRSCISTWSSRASVWREGRVEVRVNYKEFLKNAYRSAKKNIFSTNIPDYTPTWDQDWGRALLDVQFENGNAKSTRVFIFAKRTDVTEKDREVFRQHFDARVAVLLYFDDEDDNFRFDPDTGRDWTFVDDGEVIGITASFRDKISANWYHRHRERTEKFRAYVHQLREASERFSNESPFWPES